MAKCNQLTPLTFKGLIANKSVRFLLSLSAHSPKCSTLFSHACTYWCMGHGYHTVNKNALSKRQL